MNLKWVDIIGIFAALYLLIGNFIGYGWIVVLKSLATLFVGVCFVVAVLFLCVLLWEYVTHE
jgi:hypothetical protein